MGRKPKSDTRQLHIAFTDEEREALKLIPGNTTRAKLHCAIIKMAESQLPKDKASALALLTTKIKQRTEFNEELDNLRALCEDLGATTDECLYGIVGGKS